MTVPGYISNLRDTIAGKHQGLEAMCPLTTKQRIENQHKLIEMQASLIFIMFDGIYL